MSHAIHQSSLAEADMKSKLPEIASIAEVVASVGVILSLIFVGFELNEGNRETRAATSQMVIQSEMDMVAVFIDNSEVWDKVVTGAPLSDGEETRRGINLFQLAMLETANRYKQYNSGYLELESWEGSLKILPALKKLPVYEMWRESYGAQGHDSEFLELLDNLSTGE
jgi:hypothetical protein